MQMRTPTCLDNNTDCLRMNWEHFTNVPTFKTLVLQRMRAMQGNIARRQAYGARKDELTAFVNATEIPVYKIVALSATLNNQTAGDTMITKYSELIAAKYAQAYVGMAANTLRKSIQRVKTRESYADKADKMDDILANIDRLESKLALDIEQLYNAAQTSYVVAQEVKMLENTIMSSMTSTIANSLHFGNSLK